MTKSGQRQRIFERLVKGGKVPMPELSRIGSGKRGGWCGSFTRRISEIRQMGYSIRCHKTRHSGGSVITSYELI